MADYVDRGLKKFGISVSKPALAAVCIISGLLVILFPSLLVWIVGMFLMIQGALLLVDYYEQDRQMTVTSTSKSIYCRACGAENTDEATYCKKCGKELVETVQITAKQPQQVAPVISNAPSVKPQ